MCVCCRLGKIMIQATMAVYKDAIESFLPTPSKSHYIFNLRDFARVIRGVMLCPSTHMQVSTSTSLFLCEGKVNNTSFVLLSHQEGDKLIRLWIHEVYRVFYDRLIDNDDREKFFNIVKERTAACFKQSIDKVKDYYSLFFILFLPIFIYIFSCVMFNFFAPDLHFTTDYILYN